MDSFLRSGTGYFVSFNNSIDLVHFRLTYRFAKVSTIRKWKMERGQVKNYDFILIKCIYKILIIFMSRNMTKSTDGKTNRIISE